MESNNKLKSVDIKNRTYLDAITKTEDFDLDHILIDENLYEKIFVYSISCKRLIDCKSLRIRFDKKVGFIRIYVGTRDLLIPGSGKYDSIYNRIRYLITS